MKLPEHPAIVGCQPIWSRAKGGGLIADRLLITTNLALQPSDPRYDAEKVRALDIAVWEYAETVRGRYSEIFFAEVH